MTQFPPTKNTSPIAPERNWQPDSFSKHRINRYITSVFTFKDGIQHGYCKFEDFEHGHEEWIKIIREAIITTTLPGTNEPTNCNIDTGDTGQCESSPKEDCPLQADSGLPGLSILQCSKCAEPLEVGQSDKCESCQPEDGEPAPNHARP